MCDLDGCGDQSHLPEIKVKPEDRRLFLKGLASLPLASVLAFPELSQAAAAKLDDVTIKLADGTEVSAAIALPKAEKAPTVLLIHEWWGLNDQIKAVAAELAEMGYVALAVDLYGGKVGTDAPSAKALMSAVDKDKATETLVGWVDYLKNHKQSNGKVGTMGWCFGGGWSVNASIATPVDATIVYYGYVTQKADQLKSLKGPVLGHFGTQDQNINKEMVGGFEAEMEKAGKKDSLSVNWYDANHAFANPTGARYDAEDAATAWKRTTDFLKANLS
jgi:carboxymethylenebutenolidase